MNIKIFCHCSLFPSWSGYRLISTPVIILNYISFIKVIKGEAVAVHALKGGADWRHRSFHVHKFGTR